MKKTLARVKRLKDKLLGIEMELSLLESDLRTITQDLTTLGSLKRELEYNVKFLKKEGVIAIFSEYEKSVIQLAKVKRKIVSLVSLRSKLRRDLDTKAEQHAYYYEEYVKAYEIAEAENVILVMDKYRKKKQGKDE